MKRFEPLPNIACEITPELEQRIKDVNREAHALHLAVMPTLFVSASVRDITTGEEIDSLRYKANSFNRNFWNAMAIFLTFSQSLSGAHETGRLTIKRIAGAINTSSLVDSAAWSGLGGSLSSGCCLSPAVNGDFYGVVVGTSDTPENFNGYALGAKTSDGVSAGQMIHMTSVRGTTPNHDAIENTFSNSLSRIFKNQSGSAIDVKETGLYGVAGGVTNYTMFERTVFPSPIEVPHNSLIEIIYEIVFHYPEPEAS